MLSKEGRRRWLSKLAFKRNCRAEFWKNITWKRSIKLFPRTLCRSFITTILCCNYPLVKQLILFCNEDIAPAKTYNLCRLFMSHSILHIYRTFYYLYQCVEMKSSFIWMNWNITKIQYENQELVRRFQYFINIYRKSTSRFEVCHDIFIIGFVRCPQTNKKILSISLGELCIFCNMSQ